MSTIDPNAPTIQVGETAANFLCRQQQYAYSLGQGAAGPNTAIAKQWTSLLVDKPAPNGFTVA